MFITFEWWAGKFNHDKVYKPITTSKDLKKLLTTTGFPVDLQNADVVYASRREKLLWIGLKFHNMEDLEEPSKELCVRLKEWLFSFAESRGAKDYQHTITVSAEQIVNAPRIAMGTLRVSLTSE